MKRRTIRSALVALALLLSAGLSLADESKPSTAGEAKATSSAKTTKAKSAKSAKAAKKVKLVDINSASKAELKKLPGIGDADGDKIIAGRPYLSKADLLTHNVISRESYAQIHALIIAKQNAATAAKLRELREKKGH